MSVSNETNRISYTAAGGETEFDFTNILIFESSDLKIYVNGTILNSSAYTVTLSGTAPSDGTVTLNTAVEADDIIIIEREIPRTQPTVYNPGTAFPAKAHEKALDRRALTDNDLALAARYTVKWNRGKDENIDWSYLDISEDEEDAVIPLFDPESKTVTWVTSTVLNEEGGTPASVNFSAITGTLDISGADVRVADITLPYSGAVPLNLTERWQNWYTVKDFGAVGDGATDDSQAFIDCEAASGLGWVYVPSGTYNLEADVTVTNIVISTGATIEPAAGFTFTVSGGIVTGFDQIFDGDGTVKITTQRPIYTEWFGATADGATDNIAAFDKAVDACENNTCSIQLLNGTYNIGSTWTISLEGAALAGMGMSNTRIAYTASSGNDVVFSSNNACYVGDLTIQPTVVKSSGNGLVFTATNSNTYSELVGVAVVSGYTGIHFLRASHWSMRHCRLYANTNIEVAIENQFATSVGVAKIDQCTFEHTASTGTGIYHVSGGDVLVTNCQFKLHQDQYYIIATGNDAIANVIIQGCTFEQGQRGVRLDKDSGTGTWTGICINNNIFNAQTVAGVHIGDTVSAWLSGVVIDGNIIKVASGATGVLIAEQDGILVDSNVLKGISGTTVGVDYDSPATDVEVGETNLFIDLSTDFLPAPVAGEPLLFTGSATWDPGSVAFEDEVNTTVTVTGAEPGMIAMAQMSTMDNLNALLVAYVSATDTVTVALHNISDASAIDLASGTLIVYVFNPDGLI